MMRALAWLLVAAVTALTLVPPSLRPVSGLPHAAEHFFVFFAVGAALALAYPRRMYALGVSGVLFAALLELLQTLRPGRHASLNDFLIDATAVCAGIALAVLVERLQRTRRAPSPRRGEGWGEGGE